MFSLVKDDVNPTGLPQVVDELTNGAVTRTYTYGLQRINENQVVNNAWTPSFYGYDGGGNVRQLTNAAGAVTDTYEYDAYGNSLTVSGSTPNNYLYWGEQYDADLGLYYLRARYYNPLTGRFMSPDPLPASILDQVSLHRYLYAGSDPVNYIDPRGQEDLFSYAIRSSAAVPEAKLISVYGCVASASLVAASIILEDNLSTSNLIGVGGAVFGCVTISVPPAAILQKEVPLLLKLVPSVNFIFCGASLPGVVNDLNDLLMGNPDAASALMDSLGSLSGCVSTTLGQMLEGEG